VISIDETMELARTRRCSIDPAARRTNPQSAPVHVKRVDEAIGVTIGVMLGMKNGMTKNGMLFHCESPELVPRFDNDIEVCRRHGP
jgi:hypothetical protein